MMAKRRHEGRSVAMPLSAERAMGGLPIPYGRRAEG